MNDRTTKHKPKEPEMRAEYDFSGGVRGKYHKRYSASSNVVVLDPDVHRRFKNAKAVNKALRSLMRPKTPKPAAAKRSARTRAKAAGPAGR